MTALITSDSLAKAWEKSLGLFLSNDSVIRFDSTRGPCIEIEDLLIQSRMPSTQPQVSELYPQLFLPLIDSYSDGFLGCSAAQASTVSQRLYSWLAAPQRQDCPFVLNQIERVAGLLASQPESRYNIVSFWDPSIDPGLLNPVSPLIASFRIRSGSLRATLAARTVDAWLGAFPMFVGFARLHEKLARDARVGVGPISFFILSYHLYEMDLPMIRSLLGSV